MEKNSKNKITAYSCGFCPQLNMIKSLLIVLAMAFSVSCYANTSVIDQDLLDKMNRLGNCETIKINILMREQSDLTTLKLEAMNFNSKKTRQTFVIETLKRQAEVSQADVMSLLREMEQNGMVDDIRPLWIVNSISCMATKAAINDLAQRNDILTIYHCESTKWIEEAEAMPATRGDGREITENLLQVNAPQAWELGYRGQGILIALIDTGVRFDHADLAGRLWDGGSEYPNHGYDFANNNNNPYDEQGHGTHVAGTLCGTGASGSQTGIAPEATIMVLKAFYSDGTGDEAVWAAAMQFAVEHDADVINMSLGRPQPSAAQKLMMRQACDNALAAGIVAGVSAGNIRQLQWIVPPPNNITTPADCPPPYLHEDQRVNAGGTSCVISVGAVHYNHVVAEFSSEGPSQWTDVPQYGDYPYTAGSPTEIGLIRPDICAPGVQIKSLDYTTTDGYTLMDGTSMATPLVTGTIALMLSKNKELTPEQIGEILECNATPLTEHKSNDFGSGLLNAYASVQAVDYDGINESKQKAFVYPNPSSGSFTVTCEGMFQIQVFSLDGTLVRSIPTCNDTEQINNLEEGIYLLQIKKQDAIIHQKIIKTKKS